MIEVKFVVVFAVIATIITAVPLHSGRDNYVSQKLGVQKFLQEQKEYKVEPATEQLEELNFRLPNNTEPISYDLRLSTDIHRADFVFEGEVRINIRVLESTNSITLHSFQKIINQISLLNTNSSVIEENLLFTYDSRVQLFVIQLNGGLVAGQEVILLIEFIGFLRTDLMGFFRTSYFNPDTNQQSWLATTQFQPVEARHAFPCYDEIRYRTPIDLQIRHHRSYNAISNMPVAELIEDGEYVTTVFEQTLPIPTFVLAFTISDFDFVQNIDSELDFRVYGRPSAIAAGEGDESLRLAAFMLRTMERLFDMQYSIPKTDQVAIPTFASDGALNWGLITHREDIIFISNDDADAQYIRERRIAHEYSHIFFANLVAPSSWAYLWLNEGLATLYEIVLNFELNPENNMSWEQFLINNYDTAIEIDVLGLSPALNNYVESPQDIRAKFDFIAYNKGAVVLRMIGDGIRRSAFERGLSYYISELQLGSASPEDLYAGWQRAWNEDNPGIELNISSLASPWFDFAGFPVLTVRRSSEGLTLQQEGFRTLHNELFGIPITFATASFPNFNNATAQFWLTTSELEISSENMNIPWNEDNDWIVFNVRDTAYYITNYDDDLWDRIINVLNNNHEIINFFNRGTFFADFHRFISQNFDIRATIFLRLIESLPLEFNSHVWNRSAQGLRIIERRLRGTEFYREYLNYVQELLSQIYGERSFDDPTATNLVNEWSCLSGLQQCLDDALNVLIEVLETGDTNFEFDYQCNGLRAASEAIWTNFYYYVVDTVTVTDRTTDLRDLLCTENQDLVRFYLNQAVLNTTNSLSSSERELILTTAAVQHEISSVALREIIGEESGTISLITNVWDLIFDLATVANNYIQAEGLISLVYSLPEDDGANGELLIEIMQPNMDFIYRNSDDLLEWFSERTTRV